jgi:DnaJ-class molecular chaperone
MSFSMPLGRMKYFRELQLPILESVLKSQFRMLAKKLHSDTGGRDEAFIELKREYDELVKSAVKTIDEVIKTEEGILLTELGLGRKDNGSECSGCNGRGYLIHAHFSPCKRCVNGHIPYCSECHKVLDQWLEIVRACCIVNGNFARANWTKCPDCKSGVKEKSRAYHRCTECNGCGEIPVFNPVIIKNSMGGRR